MNKLNSFYKSNKPFVAVASVFVLLVCIFNYRAINLSLQSAQVISIDSGAAPFNQYPALSNSGFYLETAVNSGGFPQAMAETQSVMDDSAKNVKTIISDYNNSGCNSTPTVGGGTSVSAMPVANSRICATKRMTILNSLYTYSTYATSYYKLKYESSHGILNNSTMDWAGIAASSLSSILDTPTTLNPNVDNLLANVANKVSLTIAMSIPRGKFGPNNSVYTPPLQSDMDSLLNKLLKADMKYLLADVTVPHVALFGKEQNLASVSSIFSSSKTTLVPVINTFTINGTTGTTVDQGGALNVSWNASNVTSCSAAGGVGTGWSKSTNTAISGTLSTTMGGSTSQTFVLTCYSAGGYTSKSITVGVNPAKVVPTTAIPTTQTTQTTPTTVTTPVTTTQTTVTAPVTTTQTTTITPSNTTSGAVTIPSSAVTSGALVGPTNTVTTITAPTAPSTSTKTTVSTTTSLTPTGTDNSLVTIASTSSDPFVGPLPANPYVSPYLFVFGPNSLGNIDFKILNRASAGTAFSKFAEVNGSVGEVDVTIGNLQGINKNVYTESLTPAIDRVVAVRNSKTQNTNASSGAGSNGVKFTLSTKNSGGGDDGTTIGGTIVPNPAGINCGKTCAKTYDQGTMVILNANGNNKSRPISFDVQKGKCIYSNDFKCVIRMDSDVVVTVNWKELKCASEMTPADISLLQRLTTILGRRVFGSETQTEIINQVGRNPDMSAEQKDLMITDVKASLCLFIKFG